MAVDKVAIIPFALIVDKWRWGVFSGQITPDHYNDAWWDLVTRYQNLMPPGPRPANAFDPGAKFHVADNTPYARYLLADIYEFQFYRAAENAGGSACATTPRSATCKSAQAGPFECRWVLPQPFEITSRPTAG
jgi:peptidyl-dipeptidase A